VKKIKPNSLNKKIDGIIEALGQIEPGAVIHVSIEHDDGCPALRTHNLKDCNCEPDIKQMSSC